MPKPKPVDPIANGLAYLDSLQATERRAYLGLFAGARGTLTVFSDQKAPSFGKAECEWVEDWRDFYLDRLVKAGFLTFTETEPKPARGGHPGVTWTTVELQVTQLGWDVREAWWDRLNAKVSG